MKLERYRIDNDSESCDCQWCGYPMGHGDFANMDEKERVFCSRKCAETYEYAEKQRILGATAHRIGGAQ